MRHIILSIVLLVVLLASPSVADSKVWLPLVLNGQSVSLTVLSAHMTCYPDPPVPPLCECGCNLQVLIANPTPYTVVPVIHIQVAHKCNGSETLTFSLEWAEGTLGPGQQVFFFVNSYPLQCSTLVKVWAEGRVC